jgi:hypothetical protein
MTTEKGAPLRGEAAWKAAKQRIADRNDAAYARGRKERAAQEAAARARRADADRRSDANLPQPPH